MRTGALTFPAMSPSSASKFLPQELALLDALKINMATAWSKSNLGCVAYHTVGFRRIFEWSNKQGVQAGLQVAFVSIARNEDDPAEHVWTRPGCQSHTRVKGVLDSVNDKWPIHSLGHVDKCRSHGRIDVISTDPR